MERKATIEELLRCFREAQEDCIAGPSELPGTGERNPAMSRLWTESETSFRELERCLALLKLERRSQFWHLSERYLKAEQRRLRVRVVRKGKNVLPKLPPHSELVNRCQPVFAIASDGGADVLAYLWNPKVDAGKVRAGVDFIAVRFRGTPYLPTPILERLAA